MMASTITVSDFEKICRVCTRLAKKFTSVTLNNIIEMIRACTSVEIYPDDHLPSQICEICLDQLQSAFDFKELCENSHNELQKIYETYYNEEKFETNGNNLEDKIKTEDIDLKLEINRTFEDVKNEQKWSEIETDSKHEAEDTGNDDEDDDFDGGINSSNSADEDLSISKKRERQRNARKSSTGEKFYCELCKHEFDGVWRLGVHMKRIHNAKGKKCSKCSLVCYHDLHLDAHERSHVEKKFNCDICNKLFANMRKLRKHKIAHSTDRPYHCTKCDKSFKEKCVLTQHIKKIHVNPDPHEVCQICGKSVGKASLERHLTIHNQRSMFACSECPKKFYKEISLTKHFRRVHQNEALQYMYLCNICGRGLLSKAELKRHLCTHTGEKPYECTNCDKRYNDRGALRRHIKSAHLDERPFSCSVCSRAFHTKIILQNHMRKHTGERPYQCLVCAKSFGFKTVLQTHMKVHAS